MGCCSRRNCGSFWRNQYYVIAFFTCLASIVTVTIGVIEYLHASSLIYTSLFNFIAGQLFLSSFIISFVVEFLSCSFGWIFQTPIFLGVTIFLRLAALVVSHVVTYHVFMMKLNAIQEIGSRWDDPTYAVAIQATKTQLGCCGWNVTEQSCRYEPKCEKVLRQAVYDLVREMDIALVVIDAIQISLLVLTIVVLATGYDGREKKREKKREK